MKKVALLLVILFCVFTGCKNAEPPTQTEAAVPSAQTGVAAPPSEADMEALSAITSSEITPSSQAVLPSESTMPSSSSAAAQPTPTASTPESQKQNDFVQSKIPEEIQIRFVDQNNNPVWGLDASIFSRQEGKEVFLHTKDGKYYSGTDGLLYGSCADWDALTEPCVIISSIFLSSIQKEYPIDLSAGSGSYEFVWDLELPAEHSIETGIAIQVVDSLGKPIEGIVLQMDTTFLEFHGQMPGSGTTSYTNPSDLNGMIYMQPSTTEEMVFTYQSITFEIDYLDLDAYIEKTVTIER